jgi:tRNA1(Val) A37 N6-methylase TrmN6
VTAAQTTRDAFLGGAIHLLQPKSGYRAGLDAVLLAAACPADRAASDTTLDCGAGVGTVGLCVAVRVPAVRVTLVERDSDLAALARQNVIANGLADRVDVVCADLTDRLARTPDLAARAATFDHVLANPPYYATAKGTLADDPARAAAHAMPEGHLEAWARFMAAMAAPHGTMTMVHRADALGEILSVLESRFGALKIRAIHARDGEPATRVLVHGTKGSRAPLQLMPPLVLYDQAGRTQPDVEAILRGGAALPWT